MRKAVRRELTSSRHPQLRSLRAALRRGELTAERTCAVEGVHLVEEALASNLKVAALVGSRSGMKILEQFEAATGYGVPSYLIPDRLFRTLSQTETPQGIAALVHLPEHRLEDMLAKPGSVVAVLVGVQDPGNLGTILRGLEAFGGAACLLAPETISPFNAKAVRASAGALFRIPVFPRLEVRRILGMCRAQGLQTVGLTPRGPVMLNQTALKQPVALFVGGEASGLPAALLSRLDVVARIPLRPSVESLNAAMAASVAFYEVARQRGLPG
jgi:TrmH family RNA methyltransferase